MMVSSELRMAEFDLKISSRKTSRAAHVAPLAQEVDVDRPEHLRRLGEARQHVLEVIGVRDAQRVLELQDQVALGGARGPDEQQRLLGHRAHRHQVDEPLLGDEEAAEAHPEAVDPLTERLRLRRELVEAEVIDARDAGVFAGVTLRHLGHASLQQGLTDPGRRCRERCSIGRARRVLTP
jgi:hypothetical protein